jgi:hypothetical protein
MPSGGSKDEEGERSGRSNEVMIDEICPCPFLWPLPPTTRRWPSAFQREAPRRWRTKESVQSYTITCLEIFPLPPCRDPVTNKPVAS